MKKNPLLFFSIILIQLIIFGCSSSRESIGELRNFKPGCKLGLYKFELLQEHLMRNYSGSTNLVTAIGDAASNQAAGNEEKYYIELRKEMTPIIEDSLKLGSNFQYLSTTELIHREDTTSVKPDTLIKDNQLFACISISAGLGYTGIMGKKLYIGATWEIIGASGWIVEIETDATTEDTYGFMPDRLDPKLRQVWLKLIRMSVNQFKMKLSEKIKEANANSLNKIR